MTASLDDKLIARIKAVLLTCTRTELAARCGVSHATLGRALNGFPVGYPTRRLIELQVSK
jgi:transcriptional regulator with XRE-family HTH domain